MSWQLINRVVELTNIERAKESLEPLTLNNQLAEAAEAHSDSMAEADFFSHTGADGSDVSERVEDQGYNYQTVGENIAAGQTTAEEVVEGWMNSPGHRANILNPDYREIGIGYRFLENDTGTVNYNHYWTQVFGTSLDGNIQSFSDELPIDNSDLSTEQINPQNSNDNLEKVTEESLNAEAIPDINLASNSTNTIDKQAKNSNKVQASELPTNEIEKTANLEEKSVPNSTEALTKNEPTLEEISGSTLEPNNQLLPPESSPEVEPNSPADFTLNVDEEINQVNNSDTSIPVFGSPVNIIRDGKGFKSLFDQYRRYVGGNDSNHEDQLATNMPETLIENEANIIDDSSSVSVFIGGGEADTLLGTPGQDRLSAGAGNDLLDGISGSDILEGGEGVDTFMVHDQGFVTIRDFELGIDKIGLADGITRNGLEVWGQNNGILAYQGEQIAVLYDVNPMELVSESFEEY